MTISQAKIAEIRIVATRIAVIRIVAAMPDVLEISATFLVVTIRRRQVTTAEPTLVGLTDRNQRLCRMEMAGRTMGLRRNIVRW